MPTKFSYIYIIVKYIINYNLTTGAFGVVLQSIYCDPQTNNEIKVAVKGLKGSNMYTYLHTLIASYPITSSLVQTFLIMSVIFLASTCTLKDLESFLEECSRMQHFSHPNVLPLIGVSFDKDDNPAMVLPYISNGDVKAYLLSQRVSENDVDTFPPVTCSSVYM